MATLGPKQDEEASTAMSSETLKATLQTSEVQALTQETPSSGKETPEGDEVLLPRSEATKPKEEGKIAPVKDPEIALYKLQGQLLKAQGELAKLQSPLSWIGLGSSELIACKERIASLEQQIQKILTKDLPVASTTEFEGYLKALQEHKGQGSAPPHPSIARDLGRKVEPIDAYRDKTYAPRVTVRNAERAIAKEDGIARSFTERLKAATGTLNWLTSTRISAPSQVEIDKSCGKESKQGLVTSFKTQAELERVHKKSREHADAIHQATRELRNLGISDKEIRARLGYEVDLTDKATRENLGLKEVEGEQPAKAKLK